jgi:hypothetical protein
VLCEIGIVFIVILQMGKLRHRKYFAYNHTDSSDGAEIQTQAVHLQSQCFKPLDFHLKTELSVQGGTCSVCTQCWKPRQICGSLVVTLTEPRVQVENW